MATKEEIAQLLSCQVCGSVCKRAISVRCCGGRACRGCATKQVTASRTCWNPGCKSPMNTEDLVNDDDLRSAVQNYNNNKPVSPDILKKLKAASNVLPASDDSHKPKQIGNPPGKNQQEQQQSQQQGPHKTQQKQQGPQKTQQQQQSPQKPQQQSPQKPQQQSPQKPQQQKSPQKQQQQQSPQKPQQQSPQKPQQQSPQKPQQQSPQKPQQQSPQKPQQQSPRKPQQQSPQKLQHQSPQKQQQQKTQQQSIQKPQQQQPDPEAGNNQLKRKNSQPDPVNNKKFLSAKSDKTPLLVFFDFELVYFSKVPGKQFLTRGFVSQLCIHHEPDVNTAAGSPPIGYFLALTNPAYTLSLYEKPLKHLGICVQKKVHSLQKHNQKTEVKMVRGNRVDKICEDPANVTTGLNTALVNFRRQNRDRNIILVMYNETMFRRWNGATQCNPQTTKTFRQMLHNGKYFDGLLFVEHLVGPDKPDLPLHQKLNVPETDSCGEVVKHMKNLVTKMSTDKILDKVVPFTHPSLRHNIVVSGVPQSTTLDPKLLIIRSCQLEQNWIDSRHTPRQLNGDSPAAALTGNTAAANKRKPTPKKGPENNDIICIDDTGDGKAAASKNKTAKMQEDEIEEIVILPEPAMAVSVFSTGLFPIFNQPILVRLTNLPAAARAVNFVSTVALGCKSVSYSKVSRHGGKDYAFFYYQPKVWAKDRFRCMEVGVDKFVDASTNFGEVRVNTSFTEDYRNLKKIVKVNLVLSQNPYDTSFEPKEVEVTDQKPVALVVHLEPIDKDMEKTAFNNRDVFIHIKTVLGQQLEMLTHIFSPERKGNNAKVVFIAKTGSVKLKFGDVLGTALLFQGDNMPLLLGRSEQHSDAVQKYRDSQDILEVEPPPPAPQEDTNKTLTSSLKRPCTTTKSMFLYTKIENQVLVKCDFTLSQGAKKFGKGRFHLNQEFLQLLAPDTSKLEKYLREPIMSPIFWYKDTPYSFLRIKLPEGGQSIESRVLKPTITVASYFATQKAERPEYPPLEMSVCVDFNEKISRISEDPVAINVYLKFVSGNMLKADVLKQFFVINKIYNQKLNILNVVFQPSPSKLAPEKTQTNDMKAILVIQSKEGEVSIQPREVLANVVNLEHDLNNASNKGDRLNRFKRCGIEAEYVTPPIDDELAEIEAQYEEFERKDKVDRLVRMRARARQFQLMQNQQRPFDSMQLKEAGLPSNFGYQEREQSFVRDRSPQGYDRGGHMGYDRDELTGQSGYGQMSSNVGNQGRFGRDEPQGRFGGDEPQGRFGRDDLQGRFGGNEPQGRFGSNEPQGRFGRDEPQGRFGRDEPQGRFGRDEPQGRFGRDEPQGRFGRDEPQGRFGRDEPQGRFERDEPQGRFGRDEPHGRFGRDEPLGRFGREDPQERFGGNGFEGRYGLEGGFGNNEPHGRFGRDEPRQPNQGNSDKSWINLSDQFLKRIGNNSNTPERPGGQARQQQGQPRQLQGQPTASRYQSSSGERLTWQGGSYGPSGTKHSNVENEKIMGELDEIMSNTAIFQQHSRRTDVDREQQGGGFNDDRDVDEDLMAWLRSGNSKGQQDEGDDHMAWMRSGGGSSKNQQKPRGDSSENFSRYKKQQGDDPGGNFSRYERQPSSFRTPGKRPASVEPLSPTPQDKQAQPANSQRKFSKGIPAPVPTRDAEPVKAARPREEPEVMILSSDSEHGDSERGTPVSHFVDGSLIPKYTEPSRDRPVSPTNSHQAPAPIPTVPPGFVQPAPGSYVQPPPGSYVQPPPGSYVQPTPGSYVQRAPSSYILPPPSPYVQPSPGSYVQPSLVIPPPSYVPPPSILPPPSLGGLPAPGTAYAPPPPVVPPSQFHGWY